MSLLSRLMNPPPPPLSRLWAWVVSTARQPDWYQRHMVADTIDGRFDMVTLVTSLVLLELEARGRNREVAVLTERFVEDMDGSLREIGIGDLVVGKHMGRMIGALGGRLGAYREALATELAEAPVEGAETLDEVLRRNVYRGEASDETVAALAADVRLLIERIGAAEDMPLLTGQIG